MNKKFLSMFFIGIILFSFVIPFAAADAEGDAIFRWDANEFVTGKFTAWIALGFILALGLVVPVYIFLARMRDSAIAPWKYFVILAIWLTIFLIMYVAFAQFFMQNFYPS